MLLLKGFWLIIVSWAEQDSIQIKKTIKN